MKFINLVSFFLLFHLAVAQQNILPPQIAIDEIASTIKVEGYPDFLAADHSGIWVTNEGRVEKFIYGNEKPLLSVLMPTPCGAMAVGFGSLWVASCANKSLYRIDLATGNVLAIIETGIADPDGELSVAIGAGSVWLLTNINGELSRIDPIKNKITRRIKVLPHSFAAAFGFNFVWVTNTENGSIQKIDPIKEKVISTTAIGPTPRFLTAGLGAIWTLNQGDGTVSRIDPKTSELVITIPLDVAGTGGDIATGTNKIYVRAKNTLLSVIDPYTNAIASRYGPPAGSGAVRIENGRIWITAHDINTIWVLKE